MENIIIGFDGEDDTVTGGQGIVIGGDKAEITLIDVSVLNTVKNGIVINGEKPDLDRESLIFKGGTSCGGKGRDSGHFYDIFTESDTHLVVEYGTPFIYGSSCTGDDCNKLLAKRTSTCSFCPIPSSI